MRRLAGVSPVMREDMGEVAVVGGNTSGELSTSLSVLGERMETGWGTGPSAEREAEWERLSKGTFHSTLSSVPRSPLSQFLGGNQGHGPESNPLDLRQGLLQNSTPRPTFLPAGFYI